MLNKLCVTVSVSSIHKQKKKLINAHQEVLLCLHYSVSNASKKRVLECCINQVNDINNPADGLRWCTVSKPLQVGHNCEYKITVINQINKFENNSHIEEHLYRRNIPSDHEYLKVYGNLKIDRQSDTVAYSLEEGNVYTMKKANTILSQYKCVDSNYKSSLSSFPCNSSNAKEFPHMDSSHIDITVSKWHGSAICRASNNFINNKFKSFYAAGDNVDITISPTYMTTSRQRKSYHWFINLAIAKRVTNISLRNDGPQCDIRKLNSSTWLPSIIEISNIVNDFKFHILKVVMKFNFVDRFEFSVPQHIMHPHIHVTKEKSDFFVTNRRNDKNTNRITRYLCASYIG